jgi:hypothetical protein
MQPLFKNQKLAEQFEADGYVKIHFASPAEIKSLKEIFAGKYDASGFKQTEFFYSLLANNATENIEFKKEIAAILQPCFENYFENYRVIAESFLAKPYTTESMLLHQDWSYTDETKNNCATLWLPLQEVHAENGALFLLKGSHRFFKTIRSGSYPTARIKLDVELSKHVTQVEVKEGEAVFFHPALFHGSSPNSGNALRIITAALVLPDEETITYCHPKNVHTLNAFSLTEEYYFSQINLLAKGVEPIGSASLSSQIYNHLIPSAEMLLDKAKNNLCYAV